MWWCMENRTREQSKKEIKEFSSFQNCSTMNYVLVDGVLHYNHGPVLPSSVDEFIKVLELYKANFKDEDIIKQYSNTIDIYFDQKELIEKSRVTDKKKNDGYVYIIVGENGRFKIGASKRPEARVSELRRSSCEDHQLIITITSDDMYDLEKHLHDRYSKNRCHSEWFALSKHELRDIYFNFGGNLHVEEDWLYGR